MITKRNIKSSICPEKPVIEHIPPMNYVAVRGQGNPNNEDGDYKKSIGMLYAISYTIKMSKLGKHKLDGYFDYVVPPLEGLWWLKDGKPFDYSRKDEFCWVSMIRLPDFVKKADFDWAVSEATIKRIWIFQVQNFHVGRRTLRSMYVHWQLR